MINGKDGYDDELDDEDANAIPAMEDQDQALAAMAGYTSTEGDAKGDDSAQGRHPIRVPKKTAMESTSTSTAAQSKRKKKRESSSSSRAEELGDSDEAQPGPKKKKARLALGSEEVLPAREEDGAMSMNDGDDGDGSKTKSKGSKPLRYILFIGNVLAAPLPLNMTIDRSERLALAHEKGTSSTLRRVKQSRNISHYAVRSLPFPHERFTDKTNRSPTPIQTHPQRYVYLRPKSPVLLALA